MANDRVDSSVFPIVRMSKNSDGLSWDGLLGTGFAIGTSGWCMTARHVLEGVAADVYAVFPEGDEFIGVALSNQELHPSEDAAIFSISRKFDPWIQWEQGRCHAAADYVAMGYPDYLLYDNGKIDKFSGRVLRRPELVISVGHVRRRFSHSQSGMIGMNFIELSDVLGQGASGSPVLTRSGSKFMGIYVGERQSMKSDDTIMIPPVGLAVRSDEIVNWKPRALDGQSILSCISR